MIQQDVSLAPLTTFGVGGPAQFFVRATNEHDVVETVKFASENALPLFILGGGSNILFTKNYDGLVLKNELKGIELINEDKNYIYIKAAAGENWHQFVLHCINNNWAGVENLSFIPGSVGASPMQNIGAYGVEIKDVFYSLEAFHLHEKRTVQFNIDDCAFGYRESIFKKKYKNQFIITSVTYRLNKKPVFNISYGAIEQELEKMGVTELSIKAISDAVINIRSSKLPDPAQIGNAGSFFKNPEISSAELERLQAVFSDIPYYKLNNGKVKIPAGWLIEQCGWKGKQIGHTGNHAKQALVIVNYGNATGNEIWEHAQNVQQSIQQKFGIFIEAEVNIIR